MVKQVQGPPTARSISFECTRDLVFYCFFILFVYIFLYYYYNILFILIFYFCISTVVQYLSKASHAYLSKVILYFIASCNIIYAEWLWCFFFKFPLFKSASWGVLVRGAVVTSGEVEHVEQKGSSQSVSVTSVRKSVFPCGKDPVVEVLVNGSIIGFSFVLF